MPKVADGSDKVGQCRHCGYEYSRSESERLWLGGEDYYECPCRGSYICTSALQSQPTEAR